MAYAFNVSDQELAIIVVTMNSVDPQAFPQAARVDFYRLLAQLTRAYAKKNPHGFQLMVQFGEAKTLAALKARQRLAEVEA